MGDIVERLRGEIERRRDASGDMLHRGAPDTALTEAADEIAALRAENARLTKQVANLEARDIHSCNDECQRPLCVAQRENARLREAGGDTLGDKFKAVWKQARENHFNHSANGDLERDIQFLALGLTGEAGELANFIKKRWRDGVGHDDDIKCEIADVCAYAFMLADCMGLEPAGLLSFIAMKQEVFLSKMAALKQQPD